MGRPGDEESFRITDRRRRSEESDKPPAPPAEGASGALGSRAAGTTPADDMGRSAPEDRSLVGLFMMLGSTAAVALGAPDPVTGETHRDPAHAAALIDLLALLRERTEGNRTAEETQVLDELIYDLQLRYVRVMKPSG